MTRLQKKCFLISAGMHGLLLAILLGSSAFRDKPETSNMPILTMVPVNIVDAPGAGGGSPEPAVAPQPVQPQPQPAPAPPVVQPQPPVVQPRPAVAQLPPPKPVERPKPHEVATEPTEPVSLPKKTATKHTHEIEPDFTPANVTSTSRKTKVKPTETATDESTSSSSRADARHRQQELAQALETLATGVRNSGAKGTVVDMPGQGGGEAFAGYETVIYNAYYHAWSTPDSVADKLAGADVKIVVARDGRIISAEIIKKSGERALDRSVENALQAVTRLPPFPAGAHDEQRSFLLRFNLEAKEGSG
jgi:periplasmic protein TonB